MLRGLGAITAFILAIVLVVALAYGALFAFAPFRLFEQDIRREVTQHSREYIQTRIQELNGLISDYNDPLATVGQKQATINDFCYKVTLLLPEERPDNIITFYVRHC